MLFSKPTSRTVHHYREEENQLKNNHSIISCNELEETRSSSSSSSSISLTVWTKSLLFNGNGFTVIGPDGNLLYRVDNYNGRPDHIVLMDGSGEPIFTIRRRRKKLGIVSNNWLVYEGDVERSCNNTDKSPIFWAKKKVNIRQAKLSVLAYVYNGVTRPRSDKFFIPSICGGMCNHERYKYVVEGSYTHRSCKIIDESRSVVAEIKKKEARRGGGLYFGVDVFHLIVKPGIESRIAMAIVLLLDQMCC